MITLIPVFDKIDPKVISAVRSVFPDTKIYISSGVNPHNPSLDGNFDKLIYHENNAGMPLERIMHYYNNVIRPSLSMFDDVSDDEEILLIHDNIVINDTSKLLFPLGENKFISGRNRHFQLMHETCDRCISFTKESFIYCHSFEATKENLAGKTTVDFIIDRLNENSLPYKIDDTITVKELNSFWP